MPKSVCWMKYAIGQQVWYAGWTSSPTYITCPDCAGQGRMRVMFPDDSIVSVECAGCQRGYDRPSGYHQVYDRKPEAQVCTVTGVEVSGGKTEWKTTASYSTSEDDLFDNEVDCIAASKVKAELADAEERDRVNHREKPTHTWAWNASYHRKCLKEAKRNIEYHTSKLAVANLKAKVKDVG